MQILLLTAALLSGAVLGLPQTHVHTETETATTTATATASVLPGQATALPEGFILGGKIGDESQTPGGRVVKYRYGPLVVAAGATSNGLSRYTPEKPCTNCFVTAIEAGLEYEDGSEANINSGAWLHHMVMSNTGWGKQDLVCNYFSGYARIFTSGNERTSRRFNDVYKAGIRLNPDDALNFIAELMNESEQEQSYYVTMKYEFVSGEAAEGYEEAHLIWLDPTGCFGGSGVPAQEGEYQVKTVPWKSTVNATFIFANGHVHDGGVVTTFYRNGQEVICVSEHLYGRTPEFVEAFEHEGHTPILHVSDTGICRDFGTLKVGDQLQAISDYNATLYPPMMGHNGKPHSVMGNGHLYVKLS